MKNIKLISISTMLALVFSNCEETVINNFDENIFILTDQTQYQNAEQINVSIKNNRTEGARHFICDNVDLTYNHLLTQTDDGWSQEQHVIFCTFLGPSGYYGEIESLETKYDSLIIGTAGTYKLKYTFIVDSDTLHYLSNKFNVIE